MARKRTTASKKRVLTLANEQNSEFILKGFPESTKALESDDNPASAKIENRRKKVVKLGQSGQSGGDPTNVKRAGSTVGSTKALQKPNSGNNLPDLTTHASGKPSGVSAANKSCLGKLTENAAEPGHTFSRSDTIKQPGLSGGKSVQFAMIPGDDLAEFRKIPGSGKPSDEPAAKKRSFGKRTKNGAEPKRTFSGRDQASQAGSSGEKSEGFTTFSQEQDSGDDLVEFRKMPGSGEPNGEPAAKKQSRGKSTKRDTEAGSTSPSNYGNATPGTSTISEVSPRAKGTQRSAKPQQQTKPGAIRASGVQQTILQQFTGNDMEGTSETSDSDNHADSFGCDDDDGHDELEQCGERDKLEMKQMSESVDSDEISKNWVVAKPRLLSGLNIGNSAGQTKSQHSDLEDTSVDSDMENDFLGWDMSGDEMVNKSVQNQLTSQEKIQECSCGLAEEVAKLKSDNYELQRRNMYLKKRKDTIERSHARMQEALMSKLLPTTHKPFENVTGYPDCLSADNVSKMSMVAKDSDYIFVKLLMYAIWPEGFEGKSVTGRSSNNPMGRGKKNVNDAEDDANNRTIADRTALEKNKVQFVNDCLHERRILLNDTTLVAQKVASKCNRLMQNVISNCNLYKTSA